MSNNDSIIHLLSLNVRGLRELSKQDVIIDWAIHQHADILFLQETHLSDDLLKRFNAKWKGKCWHNLGTTASRGVAILIKENIDFELIDIHRDDHGRKIMINLTMGNSFYTFINIYAPNYNSDKIIFFNEMEHWIQKHAITDSNIIIGGDFNSIMNFECDQVGSSRNYMHSSSTDRLIEVTKQLKLVDVWRKMHPDLRQFTWRRKVPLICRRIDFWLISQDLFTHNLVKSNDIRPSLKSDHLAISLKIKQHGLCERGKGVWKLNVEFLSHVDFCNNVRDMVKKTMKEYTSIGSWALTWELCKIRIREFAIKYGKNIAKNKKQNEQTLIQEIIVLNNMIHEGIDVTDLLKEKQEKIEHIYENRAKGAQIRARVKWTEEGEKNSKYFLALEKNRAVRKEVNKIKRLSDGTVTTDLNEIIEEEALYFERLYSPNNISKHEIQMYLKQIALSTLSKNSMLICEGPLEKGECKEAINGMKKNRSPGSDGLPVEFYLHFWDVVGDFVCNSLNEGYNCGMLSPSQRKGLITLIYKKGNPEELRNWRPISLLNTDYKIAAQVLCRRLKIVIPSIINSDQKGYVSGRFGGENVRLINDIMTYTDVEDIEGAILFLDFESAFDTIDRTFMFNVLEKFNFGISFREWVKTFYNGVFSSVLNKGHCSRDFTLCRGIRQGCPLSALLFVLVSEVLANAIRYNDNIVGIPLPSCNIDDSTLETEVKIAQLADDTTLFLSNERSINNSLSVIKSFGMVSGMNLNKRKTELMWIGKWKNRTDSPFGIKWSNIVKALGIHFSYDKDKCYKNNWDDKLRLFNQTLSGWKKRHLTMFGRVLIVKSIGLSKLIYNATVLLVPDEIIKKVNRAIYDFIWNEKNEKIKRLTLIGDIKMGGIKAPNFLLQCEAIQISWLKRLLYGEMGMWKILPTFYFNKVCVDTKLILGMTQIPKRSLNKVPNFYNMIIRACIKCNSNNVENPVTHGDILNQILWGNRYITHKGQSLVFRHWISSKLIYIKDIYINNHKLHPEELKGKLKNPQNWLVEYKCILEAIPILWRNVLNRHEDVPTSTNQFTLFPRLVKTTSKTIYNLCMKQAFMQPVCQRKWQLVFNENEINWKNVWNSKVKQIKENKLAQFNFKLLHRILPTGKRLFTWNIRTNPYCKLCADVVEDEQHMLSKCIRLRNYWVLIDKMCSKFDDKHMNFNFKNLVLGKRNILVEELYSLAAFIIYKTLIMSENIVEMNKPVYPIFIKELEYRNSMKEYMENNM